MGLDVFGEKPLAAGTQAGVPNLVFLPHIAGVSRESSRRMTISATASALAVPAGEIPQTSINPDVLREKAGAPWE